jgi:hypothetical protein
MHGWVQSSSERLRELVLKCTTSAECKTDRSAVLTVKCGLDPHMMNELNDGFNIAFRLFFVALLSTNHKCTHPCLRCSEENPGVEYFSDYEEF